MRSLKEIQEQLLDLRLTNTSTTLSELSKEVGLKLLETESTLSTAESYTSGALASIITSVPGSSRYFMGGVIAYSESIKCSMLGVPASLIETFGVVSLEVVEAMAEGCNRKLGTHYSIATSGTAGPGGGTLEIPIGTVCLAIDGPGFCKSWTYNLNGDRNEVVVTSMEIVLRELLNIIDSSSD